MIEGNTKSAFLKDKAVKSVIDEFERLFPDSNYRIFVEEMDWGGTFGLAVENTATKKRAAAIIIGRRAVPGSGVWQWMPRDVDEEDSPLYWTKGPPYEVESIGILAAKDIKKSTEEAIEKFKLILG